MPPGLKLSAPNPSDADLPSPELSAPARAYAKALVDGLGEEAALSAARAVSEGEGGTNAISECKACKGRHRPHTCGKVRSPQARSPKAAPMLEPEPNPQGARYQRVFLRLVAYWMTAEEAAMIAKAANAGVATTYEPKQDGQCSFPGSPPAPVPSPPMTPLPSFSPDTPP